MAAKAIVVAGESKKVTVKSADMRDDMQREAIDCALLAIEKHSVEKDIAEFIKKEFDKKHGPTWDCIVGRNFGYCSISLTALEVKVEGCRKVSLSRAFSRQRCCASMDASPSTAGLPQLLHIGLPQQG